MLAHRSCMAGNALKVTVVAVVLVNTKKKMKIKRSEGIRFKNCFHTLNNKMVKTGMQAINAMQLIYTDMAMEM